MHISLYIFACYSLIFHLKPLSWGLMLTGYCAYLDLENAMDPLVAESIGVDTEKLLFARSVSAENTLAVVDKLVKSGSVDVIVVDSVSFSSFYQRNCVSLSVSRS